MSRKKTRLFFACCLSIFLSIQGIKAQDDNYYSENFIRNEDVIYKDNIRTVLLFKTGFEMSPPVIQLNTDEKLTLAFDDFDIQVKQYRYMLLHCDGDWNPSQIQQMEYLDGFNEDNISNYKYSFNTTKPYINYVLIFPSDYMMIKKSGNYILKVYDQTDNEENVILTRRFMVLDPKVSLTATVGNTTDLNIRYTHQQVDFKIFLGNYQVNDPYRDLFIVITQNRRWDNAVKNLQPGMIVGNELDYSLNKKSVFAGGNEFRYIDMKTLKYNTDRMQAIQYDNNGFQVYILPDQPRPNRDYISEEDINGRFVIASNNARDPFTEGDYAWVHFFVPYPAPLADGNLCVFGGFTGWQFNDPAMMKYDANANGYETTIFLKQGYYNYLIAFLSNGSHQGDLSLIEGNHWETENEYAIYVYHRQQGDFYDQLIGVLFMNSHSD